LGIVYSSKEFPGLQVGLTYFGINISNYIGQPSAQTLIDYPSLFAGAVTRGPPSPQDIQQGFLGPITLIRSTYYNFGTLNVAGFDADLTYKTDTRLGQVKPFIALTDTNRWQSALTPGSPSVSYLSQATVNGPGFAPRFKGTAGLGWSYGPYAANVDGRYISQYRDYQDYVPNSNVLGNFWLFDANLRYAIGKLFGADGFVSVGGVNLGNSLPRFSYIGDYDPAEYDLRGRFLYVQLSAKWQ
jgi:iron complex outermembrane receptor protein